MGSGEEGSCRWCATSRFMPLSALSPPPGLLHGGFLQTLAVWLWDAQRSLAGRTLRLWDCREDNRREGVVT